MARRKSSLADDLVLAPWWVSAGLAFAAYALLPAFLPTMAPTGLHVVLALGLLCLSAISALRALKTRQMLEQQTGLDSIRELPWKQFENLLGEAYRRQGYKVQETLGGGADGGVDLVLRRNGEMTVVQCKRWKGKPVPVQTVRELYGVLHDRGAGSAKLVATSRFTPEAAAFARGKPIELVDSDGLVRLLRGLQISGRIAAQALVSDHVSPDCPRCGRSMVKRTARRGANAGSAFWGCSDYPRCRGTREL